MPRQFPPRPPHLPSLSCGYQTSACADLSNGTASVPVVRQTDTGKRPRDEGGDEDEETVPDPDDPLLAGEKKNRLSILIKFVITTLFSHHIIYYYFIGIVQDRSLN